MKTAFIQGCGGLGLGLAHSLLEQNQYEHIVLASRHQYIDDPIVDNPKVSSIIWDIERPESVSEAIKQLQLMAVDLQLVVNSQGLLKTEEPLSEFLAARAGASGIAPERRIEALDPNAMLQLYYVNAIIPMLTLKALWPLLRKPSFAWLVNISAKVGSIDDNGLGGWYSYRASKAALNMLTKTLSLELHQRKVNAGTLAIHPGTVSTALSDPFISKKNDTRLTPEQSATAILKVIHDRSPEDSGTFWSWDGQALPW